MITELMLAGGALGFGGIFGLIYWRVSPVMPFLYANARVQAKTTYIIEQKQMQSLSETKSLTEFQNALSDTDYAQFLEKATTVEDIHIAIEKGFVFAVEELKKMTPDSIDPVFEAYLNFWEAKILKTFYRDRFTQDTGISLDEKLVFQVGKINSFVLSKLMEAKTVADIKVIMSQTVYREVFEKDFESLEEFETALDGFVYKNFVKTVNKTKIHDKKLVLELMNMKFDVLNLLVLIKTIAREIPVEKRKKLLIENNSALFARAKKLSESKNIEELVSNTHGTEYFAVLSTALEEYKKNGFLGQFEQKLLKHYKSTALSQELNHFQGPFPLFTYLIKKEAEQRNLLTVSKGIDAGFSPSQTKELIL